MTPNQDLIKPEFTQSTLEKQTRTEGQIMTEGQTTSTYYYLLASEKFLCEEEPLEEVFRERERDYQEKNKERDFWLIRKPAFLDSPEFQSAKAKCPQPAAAILSTNPQFITWLKLRLESVLTGEFQAPSATIPDPLASQA